MHLNIKNDEAHRLASELARVTGENMTEAVTAALRERLERLRESNSEDRLLEDVRKISRRFRELAGKTIVASTDHGDLLYDEDGLPS